MTTLTTREDQRPYLLPMKRSPGMRFEVGAFEQALAKWLDAGGDCLGYVHPVNIEFHALVLKPDETLEPASRFVNFFSCPAAASTLASSTSPWPEKSVPPSDTATGQADWQFASLECKRFWAGAEPEAGPTENFPLISPKRSVSLLVNFASRGRGHMLEPPGNDTAN